MAAQLSNAGFRLIKDCEGLSLTAYRCPAGRWTIGYGHTGQDVRPGQQITMQEAARLLAGDVAGFARAVARLARQPSENEFAAMVSLAYNIGTEHFARSTVLRLHNKGDREGAAAAFAMFNKSRGRVLPGLIARRQAEAALYLKPDDLPRSLA